MEPLFLNSSDWSFEEETTDLTKNVGLKKYFSFCMDDLRYPMYNSGIFAVTCYSNNE